MLPVAHAGKDATEIVEYPGLANTIALLLVNAQRLLKVVPRLFHVPQNPVHYAQVIVDTRPLRRGWLPHIHQQELIQFKQNGIASHTFECWKDPFPLHQGIGFLPLFSLAELPDGLNQRFYVATLSPLFSWRTIPGRILHVMLCGPVMRSSERLAIGLLVPFHKVAPRIAGNNRVQLVTALAPRL